LSPRPEDFVVFALALFALLTFAGMRAVAKAGYPGWLVLLFAVPVVDVIILLVIAFLKWPVERRLEWAEQRAFPVREGFVSNAAAPVFAETASRSPSSGRSRPVRGSWDPMRARR
jgi:hypothetical protein